MDLFQSSNDLKKKNLQTNFPDQEHIK